MRTPVFALITILASLTVAHAQTTAPDLWNLAFPPAGTKVTRVEIDPKGQEIPGTNADDEITTDRGQINTKGLAKLGFPAVAVREFVTNGPNFYSGEAKTTDGATVGWNWRAPWPGQKDSGFAGSVTWTKDTTTRRWIIRQKS